MAEKKIADGAYVQLRGESVGYYVSLATLLPNNRDKNRLSLWGVLFRDEQMYRTMLPQFQAVTYPEDYWRIMNTHAGNYDSIGSSSFFRRSGFCEVHTQQCEPLGGSALRLGLSKHRRGKRHKMHSLPLYDVSEEVMDGR